ncbi:MAG: tetratricopeptide repeat protein, partial [Myxococcales bacterium]|nr:tetratricopeptide repeat protein [Myxococcales bacterium]
EVVRGLAKDPGDRHPSMDALLVTLTRRPARRRRLLIAGSIGLSAALLLSSVLAVNELRRSRALSACADEGRAIDEIWNSGSSQRLAEALAATGSPYAATSHERMVAWLDPFAEAWARDRSELCRARVEETIAPELDERSQACFDEQLDRLGAMVDVFAHADVEMVAGAAKAAAVFSQLDSCTDEQALLQRPAIPVELAASSELRTARRQLARAAALIDAGDYAAGIAQAREAQAVGELLSFAPLEAEARLLAAGAHSELGDYGEVVEELRTAYHVASVAGSDLLAARAASLLLRVLGYHMARGAEGLIWADVAEAALARLQRTEGLDAAQLANNIGLVHETLGDFDEAERWHRQALKLRRTLLSADHPETAHSYANLGNLALQRGRLDEALRWHQRALAVRTRSLGPGHPDVARSLSNTGRVYLARGEIVEALDHFERAHEIFVVTVGGQNRAGARVLDYIGRAQRAGGDLELARIFFSRALAIQNELLGSGHQETAQTMLDLGEVLLDLGDFEGAGATIHAAADTLAGKLDPSHPARRQAERALHRLAARVEALDDTGGDG